MKFQPIENAVPMSATIYFVVMLRWYLLQLSIDLISYSTDTPNAPSNTRWTPIHFTIMKGHEKDIDTFNIYWFYSELVKITKMMMWNQIKILWNPIKSQFLNMIWSEIIKSLMYFK